MFIKINFSFLSLFFAAFKDKHYFGSVNIWVFVNCVVSQLHKYTGKHIYCGKLHNSAVHRLIFLLVLKIFLCLWSYQEFAGHNIRFILVTEGWLQWGPAYRADMRRLAILFFALASGLPLHLIALASGWLLSLPQVWHYTCFPCLKFASKLLCPCLR